MMRAISLMKEILHASMALLAYLTISEDSTSMNIRGLLVLT